MGTAAAPAPVSIDDAFGEQDVNFLWIGLGSALGGMARYGCSGVAARYIGATFPWAP